MHTPRLETELKGVIPLSKVQGGGFNNGLRYFKGSGESNNRKVWKVVGRLSPMLKMAHLW